MTYIKEKLNSFVANKQFAISEYTLTEREWYYEFMDYLCAVLRNVVATSNNAASFEWYCSKSEDFFYIAYQTIYLKSWSDNRPDLITFKVMPGTNKCEIFLESENSVHVTATSFTEADKFVAEWLLEPLLEDIFKHLNN